MVLTSCRAASTLSSTATRAPGPMASLTKSMLSACSSGRSYGWSYETLASQTSNHSGPLLPRPSSFTWCAIIVHIGLMSSHHRGAPRLRRGATSVGGFGGPFPGPPMRSAQGLLEEREDLLPAVHG